jgi:hypothetical protein
MLNLTADERYVVKKALVAVEDCLGFDETYGEYTDGDRFIFSLDKKDYKLFKSALKKMGL